MLVGLWPALRISRSASFTLALHEGGRETSDGIQRQRARAGLVIAQVALALLLLAAAGLTLKSFRNAQQTSLGFDPHNVLTLVLSLSKARYDTDEKVAAFHAQLLERIRALPGVKAAALGNNVPFDDTENDSYFRRRKFLVSPRATLKSWECRSYAAGISMLPTGEINGVQSLSMKVLLTAIFQAGTPSANRSTTPNQTRSLPRRSQ
jgi:hypothetical protein